MSTNVSLVMLTLNEEGNIAASLESAAPCFDELVLVDGGSTDGTVDIAREWTSDNDKEFQVLESSEREYLLEGPGTQRQRGTSLATNDYIMSLGADVTVELIDEDWFEQPFEFWAYQHTRTRPTGLVEPDWRLYCKNVPGGNQIAWRGMVHEELRTKAGHHVSDAYRIAEAPMVHHQQRDAAMDIRAINEGYPVSYDEEDGGNSVRTLKKQHFLLAQAIASYESRYLHGDWKDYFHENKKLVLKHAEEIADEFNIPLHAENRSGDEDILDATPAAWWTEMQTGEPIMGFQSDSFTDYIANKVTRLFKTNDTHERLRTPA